MNKISHRDALRTTTMFLCDSQIEAYYENYLDSQVNSLKNTLSGINTVDGFKRYVRSEPKAIQNILTLLGIPIEKFKRVVSWIRISKGYTFDSEWTPIALRNKMVESSVLMDEFCDLFINGYVSPKFSAIVPRFILQDFRIDDEVMTRLASDDFIRNLVKDKVSTEYNSKYCDFYQKKLLQEIKAITENFGLNLRRGKVPEFSEDELYIEYNGKYIVLSYHFYLTTSSSQTEYYDNVIQPKYAKAQSRPDIIIINILDGAGWIGRSADFRKIYTDCNFFLNLKTIGQLSEIIKEFFNI